MTLLAMLRHGETPWTAAGRLQGRTDIPLDDAARRAFASWSLPEELQHLPVVSSPLLRCRQTAQSLGLTDIQVEPRLTEMAWGRWEGQTLASLRAQFGDALQANEARGLDFRPDGGESPREVLERVRPWLAEIGAEGRAHLAVCHRGVIRVVFAWALGWDMRGKPPARLDWRCLQLFDIDAQGVPTVARLNLPLARRTAGADLPSQG
ncbi:MAG: histidine phosphatase family protein [Rhodoferax sp.]|jgi:probable phosphoglycerate mutase|nr:histidine phosphatase family protein [Rhodoferax sp.]